MTEPKGIPISPELRAEMDLAVARTAAHTRSLLDGRGRVKEIDEVALATATDEASRARAALSRMETQWGLVREQGGAMPEAWWSHFGKVTATVRTAEAAVTKARQVR